jgi:hypothetical protein
VTIKRRPLTADGTGAERRKGPRFPVAVPVEVSWRGKDGIAVKEDAVARQVSANGGFLKMSNYPNGIVVELIVPSESFWGADLQVNKVAVELQNLEKALSCEDIDFDFVREYRYAVDYIRTTMETLQRLRKFQPQGSESGELFSVLAAERIRRTSNLCLEVIADLDAGRVTHEPKGVDELQRTIQHLQQRLEQGGKAQATIRLNVTSEK